MPRQYWCGVSNIWVVNASGQLLCSKRSYQTANPGKWQTYFGGHVPVGLSFRQNAVKELQEEIGITVTEEDLFLIAEGNNLEHKQFFESYVILYNGAAVDLSKTDKEITDVNWMNMDDYWKDKEANPENWCNQCRPDNQKLILQWLEEKTAK